MGERSEQEKLQAIEDTVSALNRINALRINDVAMGINLEDPNIDLHLKKLIEEATEQSRLEGRVEGLLFAQGLRDLESTSITQLLQDNQSPEAIWWRNFQERLETKQGSMDQLLGTADEPLIDLPRRSIELLPDLPVTREGIFDCDLGENMAEGNVEFIKEKRRAHLEAVILRENANKIAKAIETGAPFPLEGWRGFTSTLPNFIEAVMKLAEVQGIERSVLLPVRTGLEDKLPQRDRLTDPADELMDYLGLPREHGSRALWEAAQQSVPVEFWGKWTELEGDK